MITSFGVASVILCVWLAHRMKIVDDEGHPAHLALAHVTYAPWLLWQIVLSNVDVSKRVLTGNISPCWVWIKAPQKTALGRAIYAIPSRSRRGRRRSSSRATSCLSTPSIARWARTSERRHGAAGLLEVRVDVRRRLGGVWYAWRRAGTCGEGPTVFDRILAVNNMFKTVLFTPPPALTERPDLRSGDDLRADQLYRPRHPRFGYDLARRSGGEGLMEAVLDILLWACIGGGRAGLMADRLASSPTSRSLSRRDDRHACRS